MKYRNVLKLVILGLAVLSLATLPPSASASTIGELSVGNCSGGGVVVTITTIDWLPASQCLQAGIPTNVTSGLGSIGDTSFGTINDLNSLPVGNTTGFAGFMTFGSVTIAAGATSSSFVVTVVPLAPSQSVTITASLN